MANAKAEASEAGKADALRQRGAETQRADAATERADAETKRANSLAAQLVEAEERRKRDVAGAKDRGRAEGNAEGRAEVRRSSGMFGGKVLLGGVLVYESLALLGHYGGKLFGWDIPFAGHEGEIASAVFTVCSLIVTAYHTVHSWHVRRRHASPAAGDQVAETES